MTTPTVAVPTSVPTAAAPADAGSYAWPRNDVGFSKSARSLRKDARAARVAARAPHKAAAAARRARRWRSPEGVTEFAAHMGMPVWGAVLTALVCGSLLGAVVGLAVFVVGSV